MSASSRDTSRTRITLVLPGLPEPVQAALLCDPVQTLAQAVYLSGLVCPPALCSGLALCGRCRMRLALPAMDASGGAASGATADPRPAEPADHFEPSAEEREFFSEAELALGWRLGCRHRPVPGLVVELPPEVLPGCGMDQPSSTTEPSSWAAARPDGRLRVDGRPATLIADGAEDGEAEARGPYLAVDLGTTSIAWRIQEKSPPAHRQGGIAEHSGSTCRGRAGVMPNPQSGAGSEVVSRLAAARSESSRQALAGLVRSGLARIIQGWRQQGGEPVQALCLAANPAMTALALGLDTSSLCRAPYALPLAGGQWYGLPGLPRLWIPPILSPFVGGDLSAGYAALAEAQPAYPFLLADLGTNAEFLLALGPEVALVTSVALGPALEGIGLTHGTEARPGAIQRFSLSPDGLKAHLIGSSSSSADRAGCTRPGFRSAQVPTDAAGEDPRVSGITGTGYLSLLNLLIKAGFMDRSGHFTPDASLLSRRFLTLSPEVSGKARDLLLPHGMRLTARDVEETLKVKAAFSLGLKRLMEHAGMDFARLNAVYVAGALGEHVDKEALENLGFFPPLARNRIVGAGNASLAGAGVLVRSRTAREALIRWAGGVDSLDLASDPEFAKNFATHMRFHWL